MDTSEPPSFPSRADPSIHTHTHTHTHTQAAAQTVHALCHHPPKRVSLSTTQTPAPVGCATMSQPSTPGDGQGGHETKPLPMALIRSMRSVRCRNASNCGELFRVGVGCELMHNVAAVVLAPPLSQHRRARHDACDTHTHNTHAPEERGDVGDDVVEVGLQLPLPQRDYLCVALSYT